MFPLILSTLLNTGFGLIVRFSQRNRRNLFAVGAINYITASLLNAHDIFMVGYSAETYIGALDPKAAIIQSYISGGGKLLFEQPNTSGYDCGWLPSAYDVRVTDPYWPGSPRGAEYQAVTGVGLFSAFT